MNTNKNKPNFNHHSTSKTEVMPGSHTTFFWTLSDYEKEDGEMGFHPD